VKRGQVIATAGSGAAGGWPFHFELRHGAKSVDPLIYLAPKAETPVASAATESVTGCSG
jgi:murein DD-endopeptidase MepM/ murein hydrolase activator NlpD